MTMGGEDPPHMSGDKHPIHKYGLTNLQRETLKKVGFQKGSIPHNLGVAHSEKTKNKMIAAWVNKIMPDSFYEKKYKFTPENNPRSRLVLNVQNGIYYHSLKAACIAAEYDYGYMGLVMQGRIKNNSNLIYA